MSYCRWENTANDLQDCMDSLRDEDNLAKWFADLSEYEQQGFRRVMSLAQAFELEVREDFESIALEL
jgi:hypothetical protein